MIPRPFLLLVFVCSTLAQPGLLAAAEISPFYTRNLQPTVQIFGLPPTEGGRITPQGRTSARLVLEAANNFSGDRNARERLEFDGETYRFTLSARRGLAPGWEAGLDLPLVGHQGGIFDSFIENWHDLLGTGEGGRQHRAQNRLFYFYQKEAQTEINLQNSSLGLGDVSVFLARELFAESLSLGRFFALRGGVKLPTGNADHLHGSGSLDAHWRLAFSDARSLERFHMTLFASGGMLWMSRGEVLPAQQRNLVWFGSTGLGWQPLQRLALKVQIDGHSAFFKSSDLRELKTASAQLVVGGSFYFSEHWILDLGVSEDIVVDTAPDVALHLALSRRF
ncbi:Protein of unknown function [Geoalkalibacter ferrihydriticus]|uniref:DUF3187 family protein n=2 Tax=Geoalkalibacter ferrihydriticus TaxID=392333 RepID=A0A0C2DQX7_9BACT|nr:DUF3187 family protein [Geoalkalibacter ferrihydriticus]KIH75839.1 hypothetical protein GFER_14750 [Geoalkalibacter ferrihydriticus DSM 17813]SDM67564.1 Protein of unknown function [Geoalkalibacter ferrihydriticus]